MAMQRRRSCQKSCSIHVYVVPTAVCTHVLYTLIVTVQLSYISDRSEHRFHPGDTKHHTHTHDTPHRVKCWARVFRLKIFKKVSYQTLFGRQVCMRISWSKSDFWEKPIWLQEWTFYIYNNFFWHQPLAFFWQLTGNGVKATIGKLSTSPSFSQIGTSMRRSSGQRSAVDC